MSGSTARLQAIEAVTRYSDAQWRKTLPRMSAAAELNPQDAADVLDYVTVTLRAMALPAAPESP